MIKTRFVKLDDREYLPQIWVPHFLWGGHWESLYRGIYGDFRTTTDFVVVEGLAVVDSEGKAKAILADYLKLEEKKRKAKA